MLVGFWIVCGIASAIIYSKKGRESCMGFILGIFLGPIGIIIALLTESKEAIEKKKVSEGESSNIYKKCPYCAELIRREAIKCRYCRSELSGNNSDDSDLGQVDNPE